MKEDPDPVKEVRHSKNMNHDNYETVKELRDIGLYWFLFWENIFVEKNY